MNLIKLSAALWSTVVVLAWTSLAAENTKPEKDTTAVKETKNLLPDTADEAWAEVQKSLRPPAPPAAWNERAPTAKEQEDYKKVVAASAGSSADKAREFHKRFPEHTQAVNAKALERQALMSAVQLGDESRRAALEALGAGPAPATPQPASEFDQKVQAAIKSAQEKGIDQKDLDKVKETLKKQNEDQMKSNDHWLNTLTRSWIEREDPQWIYDYAKKVQALTTSDIQEAAKKYLNLNNYLKGVLYPEKN